jgi:pimeloyl-ACP methyl ester carboxylesterase
MGLFVRESGPARAPAIVFLHGAYTSGWCWEPVVERVRQYRCLVPDLPHFGRSFELGPFEMGRDRGAGLGPSLIDVALRLSPDAPPAEPVGVQDGWRSGRPAAR